jgi:hypothetical protein
VIAERGNRGITDFEVFADGVVLRDVRLHFVPQAFIYRALPRDSGLPCSLGSAPCFFQRTSMTGLETAHLCRQLTPGQLAAGASLEFGNIRSLFARQTLTLSPKLALRKAASPPATFSAG